jgi:hypothetical protein
MDLKHDKSAYYLATYDTMRDKIGESSQYFRDLLLALLCDKDQERVLDRVSKVDKRYSRKAEQDSRRPIKRGCGGQGNLQDRRCFYCGIPGHFQATCFKKKQDTQARQNSGTPAPASTSITELHE